MSILEHGAACGSGSTAADKPGPRGEMVPRDEALRLLTEGTLLELGRRADDIRKALHPEGIVTFVVDRNINYTNVCVVRCAFCAFSRSARDADAYVLRREEIDAKIEELLREGGTQVLLQGGLHPGLPLEFYEDLLSSIKSRYPIHLHAFSPPEICHISGVSGLSIRETVERLRKAGLDSIPGGGAEILSDAVRKRVSPKKITSGQWAGVMREAHAQGLNTSATMVFGMGEAPEDVIAHLLLIREIQEVALAAGKGAFTAFIPWSFQPENTHLGGTSPTAVEYLRVLALSRIVLDNVPNLQVSWVTQGPKIAQIALRFGANDFGSTMMEENVVASAGAHFRMTKEEIAALIRDAGFRPAQRTTAYTILKEL